MKFAATRNDQGFWTNRTTDFIVLHLTKLIASPGTVSEAMKINTALKSLTIKKQGNASKFYGLISEGTHRRMLFQKLSQIAGPLEEELKTNTEVLIMMINRQLIDIKHLHKLSDYPDRTTKITHYIIHNVNHYERLKILLYIIQNWCMDRNLVELMEEICYEIELIQSPNIEQKIEADWPMKICDLY